MKELQDIKGQIQARYETLIPVIKPYLGWIVMAAIILVGVISYLLQPPTNTANRVKGINVRSASASAATTATPVPTIVSIKVDVSGAVKNPGVQTLSQAQRVEDAIRLAGGFAETADPDYIAANINLAAKLEDGQKIFIPTKAQLQAPVAVVQPASASTPLSASATPGIASPSNGKVSINHASSTELEGLPGIGETYAQRIVAGRPFSSVDDLCSRDGIFRSKTTCEKIRPLISL